MESNWRPTQSVAAEASMASSIDVSSTGAGDGWRSQLQPEARQRIVNKILEILKRHIPISVPEDLNELRNIAIRFEEKIYIAATSQSDYLRKISLKMLSVETKNLPAAPINPGMPYPAAVNQNPIDPGLEGIQTEKPKLHFLTPSRLMTLCKLTSTLFPQTGKTEDDVPETDSQDSEDDSHDYARVGQELAFSPFVVLFQLYPAVTLSI